MTIKNKTHQKDENFSDILNKYIMNENWSEAKRLLTNELEKAPMEHYLLTQLGEVYYELFEYDKALELTQKAVKLAPECPLSLNNHAVVLFIHERFNEAIEIWQNILKRDINEIAYGQCNEGMSFAKSLVNDIKFRLGDAFLELGNKTKALEYYNEHLSNRKRGQFSNFSKNDVEKEIRQLTP